MDPGIAGMAIGAVIVIGIILLGAMFVDRARSRRLAQDAPERAHTDEELAERTRQEHEQGS